MGDAAGVGPEIIVKALTDSTVYETCNPLVIGDAKMLERAKPIVGAETAVMIAVDNAQIRQLIDRGLMFVIRRHIRE